MGQTNIKVIGDKSNTTIFIAEQIIDIFSEIFPFIEDKKIIIYQAPHYDYPYCATDKSHILITAESTYYCQISFQIAHELLHFIIPGNYNQTIKNQRFEESLADMMSSYILQILCDKWRENYLASYDLQFGINFSHYFNNESKKIEAFKIKELNSYNSELLNDFQSDPYKREHLKYLALKMLPIFKEHPILWQSILHLHRISDNLTLSGILNELSNKFPPAASALKKLNEAILSHD